MTSIFIFCLTNLKIFDMGILTYFDV